MNKPSNQRPIDGGILNVAGALIAGRAGTEDTGGCVATEEGRGDGYGVWGAGRVAGGCSCCCGDVIWN